MKKDEKKDVWAGKVRVLSLCLRTEESEDEALAFLRYLECESILYEGDESLRSKSLHWTTKSSAKQRDSTEKKKDDRDSVALGEWSGAISLQSILGTVDEVCADNAIHPFSMEMRRASHQFYSSSFSGEFALKKSRLDE